MLLGNDGTRVIDFGIARAMDAATTASSVVGTPGYMSPEQIAGRTATAASDLFSWASTIAFAATGRPLFGRDSIPAVMNRILNQEPDLGALGEPLRSALDACLAKDPSQRPSADEVLAVLRGRRPVPRRVNRRRSLVAAGIVVHLVVGVLLGLTWKGSVTISGAPQLTDDTSLEGASPTER